MNLYIVFSKRKKKWKDRNLKIDNQMKRPCHIGTCLDNGAQRWLLFRVEKWLGNTTREEGVEHSICVYIYTHSHEWINTTPFSVCTFYGFALTYCHLVVFHFHCHSPSFSLFLSKTFLRYGRTMFVAFVLCYARSSGKLLVTCTQNSILPFYYLEEEILYFSDLMELVVLDVALN